MKITRTSLLSQVTRTLDLNVTPEQMTLFEAGTLAQKAFPQLSPGDREFIISGITSKEWDDTFKDEDEDINEETKTYE